MSVMITQQRMNLEQTRTAISRQLLAFNQNAQNFDAYLKTIPSNPEALLSAPYSMTADEAYALRRFTELAAALARVAEDGGTVAPGDATTLMELVAAAAGTWVISPNATSAF